MDWKTRELTAAEAIEAITARLKRLRAENERLRVLLNDALYSMVSDDYEEQEMVAAEIKLQLEK